MILCVGHPRCGTGYMAALFQAFGVQVRHEAMGRDGTSCWSWSAVSTGPHSPDTDGEQHPGLSHEAYDLVQVIRDPRKALWSIAWAHDCARSTTHLNRFRVQVPGWSELDNAALSYVSWNRMIEAQAPDLVVPVERAPGMLAAWLGKPVPAATLPPTDTNTKPKRTRKVAPEDCLPLLRPEALEIVKGYADQYYELDAEVRCA